MSDFSIRRDDTLPELQAVLRDAEGVAVNLTGITSIAFQLREPGAGTPKTLAGVASVVDAAAGTVKYAWASGDTDTVAIYLGEFVAVFSGKQITFPNKGYLVIDVTEPVA